MNKQIFIISFSLSLFSVGHVSAQDSLSLNDALAIGLEKNVGIIVARGNAEIGIKQEGLGTAGFLPRLDASSAANQTNSDVETNSPFSFGTSERQSFSGSVALNWTLFDGFNMFYNNARYGKLSELGSLQLRQTVEVQVADIITAYLDVVRKERLLSIATEGASISKVRLEREEVRKNLGGASTTDYLSAKIAYNNDLLSVLKAETQLDISKRNLNILLGRSPDIGIRVDSLIVVNKWDIPAETVWSYAERLNSTIRIQQYQVEISDIDVGSKRSAFWPVLNAAGSYSYSDQKTEAETRPDPIESKTTDTQVGLNLSWNLFNGNRDNIGVQTSKITLRNQDVLLSDSKRQIRSQINNQWQTYRNAVKAYDIETENMLVAELNLKLFVERYQFGSATFIEYRQAQLAYLQSKSNIVDAAFLTRVAETGLRRIAGVLINEQLQVENPE